MAYYNYILPKTEEIKTIDLRTVGWLELRIRADSLPAKIEYHDTSKHFFETKTIIEKGTHGHPPGSSSPPFETFKDGKKIL